jgi:hypothetical protein
MQIVGLLIIVIAILIIIWWARSDRRRKRWVVAVSFMLFAGVVIMLQDRIVEISLPKGFGTIKAAARQATADAEAIANLKKRVEDQSATVDSVANSAREARKLGDELSERIKTTDTKLTQVDQATRNAQAALEKMEQISAFATVLLAAQNDDWQAFNQLLNWVDDQNFPLHEVAASGYVAISSSHTSWLEPGYLKMQWGPGVDPSHLSLSELGKIYSSHRPVYHADIVLTVWNRSDIPKKERMEFLVQVLKTSNSVTAKYFAAKLFVEATDDKDLELKLHKVPFRLEPLLEWWESHKNSIK